MLKNIFNKKFFFYNSNVLIRAELISIIAFLEFFAFWFSKYDSFVFSYTFIHGISALILMFSIFIGRISILKKNIRDFYNVILLLIIINCIYSAYINDFNRGSFYAVLLTYSYLSFLFSSSKHYLKFVFSFSVILLIALIVIGFKTITPISLIVSSIFMISLAGFVMTSGRKYYKNKIIERENLLNHIFNNSIIGFILVKKESSLIHDVNDKVVSILNISDKKEIIKKKIQSLKIDNQYIFRDLINNSYIIKELKDKRIVKIIQKEIKYKQQDYLLILIEEFKNEVQLKESSEIKKLIDLSEESYHYLFHENTSYMCIIDINNNFIDVNKSLCNATKYSKEELVGKNISLITVKEIENREQLNKEVWLGKKVNFEKSVLTKEGNIIQLEVELMKGKYFGKEVLISNARDIGERKKLEKEALISNERYRNITEQSSIGFVVSDIEGNILENNSAFRNFLGYSKEELSKKTVYDISFKEHIPQYSKVREELIQGKILVGEMEKRYYKKDGSYLCSLIKIVLQKDEQNKPKFFFAQVVDITEIKNAQQKLEISEKSYKDLFNYSEDLLYILNRDNQFVDINLSVLNHYGFKREEIIGSTPIIFSAPGQNNVEEFLKQMMKVWEGENIDTLWWGLKKSGEVFPKRLTIRKGFYLGEEVLVAKGKDISQSYKFEKKLQDQEKLYRDLFERNLAGVYRTSKNGDILECNPAFLKILGYDQEENDKEPLNTNKFYVDEKTREKLLSKVIEKKYVRGEKIELRKKNGDFVTVILNVSAIYDGSNKFEYYEGSVIDITELEIIQDQLYKSEKRYKELIESSSFGIIISKEAKFVFANLKAIQILGYSNKEDLIGKDTFEVLLKKDEKTYSKQIKALVNKRILPFSNYTIKKKGGKLIEVEAKPTLVEYDGKTCVQVSFIDISDRRKIEAATEKIKATEKFNEILQKELKEKEILLKEVHHRVKNNMQVISSILNLQSNYSSDKKVSTILRESQNRIRTMALIHEKLYTTKDFTQISFSNYLRELVENIISSYELKNTKINSEFDLEEVFLSLDQAIPCGLIINELISNSLKYAFINREKGTLKASLKKKEDQIELVISDNGIGLSNEINFKSTETLGLQLVNTLVDQLKGSIELNNENGVSYSIKFNSFE